MPYDPNHGVWLNNIQNQWPNLNFNLYAPWANFYNGFNTQDLTYCLSHLRMLQPEIVRAIAYIDGLLVGVPFAPQIGIHSVNAQAVLNNAETDWKSLLDSVRNPF